METSKHLILLGFLFALPVFAFNDQLTHPNLTNEAIELYNRYYPRVSYEDLQLIKQGSIDEDLGIRSTYHFYDPVYNRGIAGMESSKKWAEDTIAQGGAVGNALAGTITAYFGGNADYSWERAVYEYVHGDKRRGLETLGHIVHLIEDAAVPDHTRNDEHLPYFKAVGDGRFDQTSPFETYANDPHDVSGIAEELMLKNKRPLIYSNLDAYFDNVANYSNNNFFSRDTILIKTYSEPKITTSVIRQGKENNDYSLGYGVLGPLVQYTVDYNNETGEKILTYSLKDEQNEIFNNYWAHLSRVAVQNSAGVIKLFFDAVEEEKRTGALAEKNKSSLAKVWDTTKDGANSLLAAIGLGTSGSGSGTTTPALGQKTPTTPDFVPPLLGQEGIDTDSDLGAGLPTGDDEGMTQAEYLQSRILRLQTQLLAAQIASDPNADWPPLGAACSAQ
ncbi:MAG: hypothetical protein NTY66_03580 [Candidatus Vogelbacteria bacterium]|nr:hypothetical protein [Candidatus Vogelbacteria bacterium]